MKYRAAIGSFNGEYVDQHFGHVKKYYIYEFDSETGAACFVERRFVDTECECHAVDGKAFADVFEKLQDVGAIIISKIGRGASTVVEKKGYVIYESFAEIGKVVQQISDGKLYEVDQWRETLVN